jgi:hypothetical protein
VRVGFGSAAVAIAAGFVESKESVGYKIVVRSALNIGCCGGLDVPLAGNLELLEDYEREDQFDVLEIGERWK